MILSQDVLVNNILTEISDNSNGQITPYDIRHNLLDIVDSVHLLTIGKPLTGSNFSTNLTRTTRVGDESISRIDLPGYFSVDNTAVGFASLKSNYQGIKNTAIGSYSLFCNIYGEYNSALGYSSLGGNTIGIGNVGIGSYSLNNNKNGNFNIAIGHGAGYYAANGTSNKLFIASYPIDSGYICDNPLGSGLTPLLYGDLAQLQLGIGVIDLVPSAMLQVGGNTIPSSGDSYSLGASGYRWSELYTRVLNLDNNAYLSGVSGNILCSSSFYPQSSNQFIGLENNPWQSGYFDNIKINGSLNVARLVSYEQCNYFCHVMNLANPSSGTISLDGGGPESLFEYAYEEPVITSCGLPSDIEASGAGIMINTSGTGYQRQYNLLFTPPDTSLTCLQSDTPHARASWSSNVSLNITSGNHLRTDRIIFPSSINIVSPFGCFGIFSRSKNLYVSNSDLFTNKYSNPSNYIAGIGNINFYANSGDVSDYIFNISSLDSGITLRQRFLSGTRSKVVDTLNNNLDKLRGFEFQYIDDSNGQVFGPISDRFVIGSYNNTSEIVNAITLMKNNQTEGILGINNLSPSSKNIIPSTSLNIRSANNAIGRFTAENQANTISAIQLLGQYNCLYNGFEASYRNGSGVADLSMYINSGKIDVLRFYSNNTLGLFTSSGTSNAMFTLGDNIRNNAVISFRENSNSISATPQYGKLFVKPKNTQAQSHSIYFLDGSGNLFDLILNTSDPNDGRFVYTDTSGNTFAGIGSTSGRSNINFSQRNTAYGNNALFGLFGGNDNTAFGKNAGSGIRTGNNNTILGANTAQHISTGINNLVLGANSFNNTTAGISNNIIIGTNGVGNNSNTNYQFIVGNSGLTLLYGILGPTNNDKYLSMPSGGKLSIYDLTNTDSLDLRANYIDVTDRAGSNYPNNDLVFRFKGNLSADLLQLNHSVSPMTNSPVYTNPIPLRPYAQLNGDLKLRGSIRFSDSTSLDSSNFLQNIDILQSGLNTTNSKLDTFLSLSSFIEGYVDQDIDKPSSPSNPTSGILYTKNQYWANNGQVILVNKDPSSIVHSGAYVIAIKINDTFRPIWISSKDSNCVCCR